MDILLGPDDETLRRIKAELKEDPERFENNLKLLEKWMECQSHLPKNYDKRMLPIYLRSCKHDMEKVKKKLELYFIVKAAMPEIFLDRNPEEKDILEIVDITDLAVIPKLTPEGYRVTINRLKTSDTRKFKVDLMMRRGSLLTCLRTVMEKPIAGDILIFDAANITAAHVANFITPITRRCIIDGPEAYPNRLRQVHIVNAAPIVEKLVGIVKSFTKDKLRNRFHVHTKTDGLKDFIPIDCLPNDYGGTAGTLKDLTKKAHDFVISQFEWFKQQEDVKLIGPLPERYHYQEDFGQGVDGSFRKLAID